jgi:acetyl-CoA C-acetyltransferase
MPKAHSAFSRDAVLHDTTLGWRFINPRLQAQYGTESMPETAEIVAREHGIPRAAQDAFALASQHKALAAQQRGFFDGELCPVSVTERRGEARVVARDEHPRDTDLAALARLSGVVTPEGTVTAGNASGLNDGAAAVMVMTAAKAAALGLKPLARIASYASAGLDPSIMGMGPVPAAKKALERAGWKPADLDLLEINEAFAAQACAVHQEMGWDTSKVNVNGGAIAIGHPIGASGCRILVTLLHEMIKRDARKGIASLCIGGGMGVALTVER